MSHGCIHLYGACSRRASSLSKRTIIKHVLWPVHCASLLCTLDVSPILPLHMHVFKFLPTARWQFCSKSTRRRIKITNHPTCLRRRRAPSCDGGRQFCCDARRSTDPSIVDLETRLDRQPEEFLRTTASPRPTQQGLVLRRQEQQTKSAIPTGTQV